MRKKIVIIGALGYIGTELCKIYSGESWKNFIVAIDSRFISERVNQLREWNIEFHQGGLLDKDFLEKNLTDADIVYHLAGITDVAYVKKDSNVQQDEKIKTIAIDGTRNVLNSGNIQAIVANSGCANTAVGIQGLKDAEEMANITCNDFSNY